MYSYNSREKILRYLYENGSIRTIGIDLFEIRRRFDINNIQDVGQSLVHDGLAEFTSGSTINITSRVNDEHE